MIKLIKFVFKKIYSKLFNIKKKRKDSSIEIEKFIKEYSEILYSGKGVYFIGAGFSKTSGLPNWKELIEDLVKEIGIFDVNENDDLPMLAQFYVNKKSKEKIFMKINKEFKNKDLNNYHKILINTNIKTIWTTNYDDLIEKCFSDNHNLKINDNNIFSTDEDSDKVEIIKIHGTVNGHFKDLVICKSDYEDFFQNRPAIVQRLKIDLLQKSFLFIGYNYNDPNIQNIIIEARRLKSEMNNIKHFILLKDKFGDQKFKMWCDDLSRYNILPVLYNEYSDLEKILTQISLKCKGKSVFISGSHQTENVSEIEILVKFLVSQNIILVDGQSTGVMREAVTKFTTYCLDNNIDYLNRIKLFPNPYASNPKFSNNLDLLPKLKKFRKPLFKSVQIMVAFDGNSGTCAEIETALEMGCIVLPFFKDRTKLTWSFIDKLHNLDEDYVAKMRDNNLKMEDLLKLLRTNL
ncbi:SIR2 family protein [Empedobacter brevis]